MATLEIFFRFILCKIGDHGDLFGIKVTPLSWFVFKRIFYEKSFGYDHFSWSLGTLISNLLFHFSLQQTFTKRVSISRTWEITRLESKHWMFFTILTQGSWFIAINKPAQHDPVRRKSTPLKKLPGSLKFYYF